MKDIMEDFYKEEEIFCSKCKDKLTVGEVKVHYLYKGDVSPKCYQCSHNVFPIKQKEVSKT